MNALYREALSLIQQYDTVILHRHAMPDGDAVGSQTGLKNLLEENFPGKTIRMVGDSAARFSFLPMRSSPPRSASSWTAAQDP